MTTVLFAATLWFLPAQPAPDAEPAAVVVVETADDTGFAEQVSSDPIAGAGRMVNAMRDGNWRLVAAFVLALIMACLTRMRDRWRLFRGDRGGAALVMTIAMLGVFAATLASGVPITMEAIVAGAATAWTACGGYNWFKRILWPNDQRQVTVVVEPAPPTEPTPNA
jgi:hypothetical protein